MRSTLKRFVSWIVLLAIVFTILPAEVSADTNVAASGKLGYKIVKLSRPVRGKQPCFMDRQVQRRRNMRASMVLNIGASVLYS